MDSIETEKKREKPVVKGVRLFKEEKYAEAIIEFTKYLKTNPDDKEKKVAHYNRGMAHHFLGQHSEALLDGENCIKLDPFWAKGYKCKGLALEGMKRPRDAIDALVNGQKMTVDVDENSTKVLIPLIKRLNKEAGYLEGDFDLNERKRVEKYCIVCDLFENDLKIVCDLFENDLKCMEKDKEKFTSCEKCEMVNYCTKSHKQENMVVHKEVCKEFMKIKKQSEQIISAHIVWIDEAVFLTAMEVKGPLGKKFAEIQKTAPIKGKEKDATDMLKKREGFFPISQIQSFPPASTKECDGIKTWESWFESFELPANKKDWEQTCMAENAIKKIQMTMSPMHPRSDIGDLTQSMKEAYTQALTNPMTVFYAMKQAGLLANLVDKHIILHVVGAEPREELMKIKAFHCLLLSFIGMKLRIVLIGPLLPSPPDSASDSDLVITTFGGTYQDYLLSGNYQRPDCIVAFFPGIYDRLYNWAPAIAHAIAKNVPFLVTCNFKKDYADTKKWLEKECGINPNIPLDYLNPFASLQIRQQPSGSNRIHARNMFCLLLLGGKMEMARAKTGKPLETIVDMVKLENHGML